MDGKKVHENMLNIIITREMQINPTVLIRMTTIKTDHMMVSNVGEELRLMKSYTTDENVKMVQSL